MDDIPADPAEYCGVRPIRACDSLGRRHNEAVRRLAALAVPPSPSPYDPDRALSRLLLDQVAYLRVVTETLAPLFERCADDAADYGGARSESFDLVRASVEDFVAPISSAAYLLEE